MITLASIVLMFSGINFLSMFTFIMYCRRLGLDPQIVAPKYTKDIDIVWSCKLAGIVMITSFCILYDLLMTHPIIQLGV
jgi:hypothetical protein